MALTSTGRHRILIASAAVVVGTLQFVLIDRGGFWLDDFVNLANARRLGLSVALLVEPVYQHFAPGHRVLDWLVAVPFDESYTAAVLILVLFLSGAVVVFTLLCDECFGRSDIHVLLAVAAGSSWTLTDTGGWFAAAAHAFPSIFFTQLALLFYVRWYRSRRPADYALALLIFAIALMFWEMSLLFLVEAILLAGLLLGRHDTPAAVSRSMIQAVPRLISFAAVALAYVIYVSAQPWHQPFEAPTGAQLSSFTRIFVLRGLLPPLVGTGTPFGPLSSFEQAMQILACVLLIAGLVVAALARRAIIRACVFLVGTLGVAWFAVAGYRLRAGGVWVGETSRLIAPTPFLFWFSVAIAFQPAAGRALASLPRIHLHPSIRARWAKSAGALALVTVTSLYVLNLKYTDDERSFGRLEGLAGMATAQEIARGVRIARAHGMLSSFVESPIPEQVAFPGRWDDTLWRMGPYFDHGIHAIGEGKVLLRIEPTGAVRENKFLPVPLVSDSSPVSCHVYAQCTTTLIARHPPTAEADYVRITLTTSGPTRLRLGSVPKAEPQDIVEHRRYYDDTTRHLVLPAGHHTLVLALWTANVTSAWVIASGHPVDLRAELGALVPGTSLS